MCFLILKGCKNTIDGVKGTNKIRYRYIFLCFLNLIYAFCIVSYASSHERNSQCLLLFCFFLWFLSANHLQEYITNIWKKPWVDTIPPKASVLAYVSVMLFLILYIQGVVFFWARVIQFLNSAALFLLMKSGSGSSIGSRSNSLLSNQMIISVILSRATIYCLFARKKRVGSKLPIIESNERL